MNGRVLPNNLEAEQSVLGACFLSNMLFKKPVKIYRKNHFIMIKMVKSLLL